jgi:hypothetical protein
MISPTENLKYSPNESNQQFKTQESISNNNAQESHGSSTVVVELFNSNSNSNSINGQIEAWKNQVASYRLEADVNPKNDLEQEELIDRNNEEKSPKFQKTSTGKSEPSRKTESSESPGSLINLF